MIICDNDKIKIVFSREPVMVYNPECKRPLFDFLTMKWKPFINKRKLFVTIIDKERNEQYTFLIEKNYRWNGSNVPFGTRWIVGKPTEASFIVASCIHDKMCEEHNIVNNNRYISSRAYKEILMYYQVNSVNANVQFFFVDNFQKFIWR